jgi:hypothetical protein
MAMSSIDKMKIAALPLALAAVWALAGCGTPGAPQPPSLNLPERVADLTASRAGNQVALTWTMPKRNTDKLLLKGNVTVRVCRGDCGASSVNIEAAPGANAAYTDTLPAELTAGAPRPLSYFVELRNRNGRSAGPSNAVVVLAGVAPAPVAGLSAEVRKDGMALRWTPIAQDSSTVRLHRKLLTPPAAKPHEGLLAPQPEPVEQSLIVEAGSQAGRGLDKNIRFGQSYEYRAQRVARVTVDGKTLELAGPLSAPLRVEARDIFPPDTPTALAAVATTVENGSAPAIDLSWQPVSDADLSGYIVYRRETEPLWQRISPSEPLIAPAFRDSQVQPGHSYRYAVTGISQSGHESARSAEAEESVPNP